MNDHDRQRREVRRNQMVGLLGGLITGAIIGNSWPGVREAVGGAGGVMLWGAAIGASLGSLPQFEKAGKVITRSENRAFNLMVGLSIPTLVIGVLAVVFVRR
ncbi:MAG: hypothetical protein HYZ49_03465 [Chloroflexi bacterium]|nr:hypothetical protein [Chloroflexota bacterium]